MYAQCQIVLVQYFPYGWSWEDSVESFTTANGFGILKYGEMVLSVTQHTSKVFSCYFVFGFFGVRYYHPVAQLD